MASEEEEIINLIAQELGAGKSEQTVVAELVQAGLPQQDAIAVVQAVSAQVRGRGGGAPRQGGGAPPRKKSGMSFTTMILIAAVLIVLYLMFIRR